MKTPLLFPKSITIITVGLVLIFFPACRKDKICLDGQEHLCNPTLSYMPMAVGNYWIYDVVSYDHATNSGTYSQSADTTKIVGVSTIGSNEYYIIEKDRWFLSNNQTIKDTTYWRDSIGYIVNERGDIKFSAVDFDNILYTWLPNPGLDLIVDFSVKDSIIYYRNLNDEIFECLDYRGCATNGDEKDSRPMNNYFAKSIGLAFENNYYVNPNTTIEFRRELREYHLE